MSVDKNSKSGKSRRDTVLGWMGTLLLCAIPGVNLIALVCYMLFSKSASKRHFAIAALLWILIALIIAVALLMLIPDVMLNAADTMRELAQPKPTLVPWQ